MLHLMRWPRVGLVGGALLCAAPVGAQAHEPASRSLSEAMRDPITQRALRYVDGHRDSTAALLKELGGIIAPSGHEAERAAAVQRRMHAIGLARVVSRDGAYVSGVIPGRSSGSALVFVSTLDDLATVAEHQRATGKPPRIEGDRVVGPGTNTSATTAALLAAAEALLRAGVTPEHDLVFAAVAQEETGLVGMRQLYNDYKTRASGFVDVLGDGQSISYGAMGIDWWTIVAHGPSGHTLNGGLPNVNQGIARAVDRIFALPQPARERDTRTVLNVAVLRSGEVYNHKPDSGWFSLDIRSLDSAVLKSMERDVRRILADVERETSIELTMTPYQITPGGQIAGARTSALVTSAEAIARARGVTPEVGNAGSSNMNIAIAGGTMAIGLGGERGGRRGFPDEWADIPAMLRTAKSIVLLAMTVGGR